MLPKWPGTWIREVNWANVDGDSNEHMAWTDGIILSLFFRWLLHTSLCTLLHLFLFILFCIGRTVACRGKHSSTLTFLCVVITEQTVRLLAGLYSLSLSFFPPCLSDSTGYFCGGKYLHFSVAFPLCCVFLSYVPPVCSAGSQSSDISYVLKPTFLQV